MFYCIENFENYTTHPIHTYKMWDLTIIRAVRKIEMQCFTKTISIKMLLTWALNFSKPITMLESKAWLIAIRTIKLSFIVLILFQTQMNMNLVIVTITIITMLNQSTIFVNATWVWQRNTGRGPNKTRRFLIPQTKMP